MPGKAAQKANLNCSYQLVDIRAAELGSGYDLAMFIFGEFNVFTPQDAKRILEKMHAAIRPGGALLLEVAYFRGGPSDRAGSPPPGIRQPPAFFLTGRICVCRKISGMKPDLLPPSVISSWMHRPAGSHVMPPACRPTHRINTWTMLKEHGFQDIVFYPSLAGVVDPAQSSLFAILAWKIDDLNREFEN